MWFGPSRDVINTTHNLIDKCSPNSSTVQLGIRVVADFKLCMCLQRK